MPEMVSEIADLAKPAITLQTSVKPFVPSVLQENIVTELRFLPQQEIALLEHIPLAAPRPRLAQAATPAQLHHPADFVQQGGSQQAEPPTPYAAHALAIHAATAQRGDGPRGALQNLSALVLPVAPGAPLASAKRAGGRLRAPRASIA